MNFRVSELRCLVLQVGYWTATEGVVITKPFEKVRSDVAQDITRRKFRVGIKMVSFDIYFRN